MPEPKAPRRGHGHGSHTPAELNPEAVKAGHEVGDVPLKPIFNFLIGLTVLTVVSFVVVYGVFLLFAAYKTRTSEQPTPMAARQAGQLPPQPRLQVDALKEWVVFKAEQDSLVGTYGWVDKGKGIVRLPQDRALEIMSERAWPHRDGHYTRTGQSTMAPVSGKAAGSETPAEHVVPGESPVGAGHTESPHTETPHTETPQAPSPAEGH